MFALQIVLLHGNYDASTAGATAEWPPHPSRAFCALVAVARDEADDRALTWLERQPPPSIWCAPPEDVRHNNSQVFVVTDETYNPGKKGKSHATFPARTANARTYQWSVPKTPVVQFVWPTEPDRDTAEALDRLACRVPYFGRASCPATASFVTATPSGKDGLVEYLPQPGGTALISSTSKIGVAYDGYLAGLRGAYAAGQRAWEIEARPVGYLLGGTARRAAAAAAAGPFHHIVTARLKSGSLPGRFTARVSEAFRRALMSRIGQLNDGPVPDCVSGHGVDAHAAFFPLLNAGYDHSDGALLGIGIAFPDLDLPTRARIELAMFGREHEESFPVHVPSLGALRFGKAGEDGDAALALSQSRWRATWTRWASATPVILDHYPRNAEHEAETLLRAFPMSGYPAPVRLTISRRPAVQGGLEFEPQDLPERARGRLYRHICVQFDQEVQGPLLVGAGRYRGVGLLVPHRDQFGGSEARDAQPA